MSDINKSIQFMIAIAKDDSHGYDQNNRYGTPDYDCSSLIAEALKQGGFNVSKFSWTGNLEQQLRNCGFIDCSKPWKAGDIHLKTGKHVVMSINDRQIAHASQNEFGGSTGGQQGDQTGKEVCIRDYYEYQGGWDCHLRYGTNESAKDLTQVAKEVIQGKWGNGEDRKKRLTNAGYNYSEVQKIVNSLMNKKDTKSYEKIAKEVIAGKWGNGEERKRKMANANIDYNAVQSIVNRLLKG